MCLSVGLSGWVGDHLLRWLPSQGFLVEPWPRPAREYAATLTFRKIMINSIKITNFRKHRDSTLGFLPGFNVIRGANEASKSTCLEAIAYALFGVKSIRSSLAEAVTWGEPEATLRVVLELTIGGVAYTVSRGKSGAECAYAGGTVTGQTEVTNFMSAQLRVDPTSATRLMFSAQMDIRGALESGTKATTELIEKLSSFDQIDNLIELMQEKLTLGNTATATAAIASAANDLERAKELAVPVDADTAQALIDEAQMAHGEALTRVAAAEAAERAAQEAHATLREQAVRRDNLVRDVARAKSALDSALQRFEAVVVPTMPKDHHAQVEALRKQITDVEQADRIALIYEKVRPYTVAPTGTVYEGTPSGLLAEIAEAETEVRKALDAGISLKGDLRLLEAQLTHGTCTFCGKDFSGVPEVAARNADTMQKISETEAAITASAKAHRDSAITLGLLRGIAEAQRGFEDACLRADSYVEVVDPGTLPHHVRWVGPEVGAKVSVEDLKLQIKRLEEIASDYTTAVVRRDEATKTVKASEALVAEAQAALTDCPEVTLVQAQTELDAARDATRAARDAVEEARRGLDAHTRALADQQAAYTRAVEEIKRVSERLGTLQAQLVELEFNNALLKKVRTCRPLLADKLWTLVLAASSSSYFSDIRGVKSRVTKSQTASRSMGTQYHRCQAHARRSGPGHPSGAGQDFSAVIAVPRTGRTVLGNGRRSDGEHVGVFVSRRVSANYPSYSRGRLGVGGGSHHYFRGLKCK